MKAEVVEKAIEARKYFSSQLTKNESMGSGHTGP